MSVEVVINTIGELGLWRDGVIFLEGKGFEEQNGT